MQTSKVACFFLLLLASLCSSEAGTAPSAGLTFNLPGLGLRYTPPSNMMDKTRPASRDAREHAASYAGKVPLLLLDMSSGLDTSPDWHQLWILVFPRAQLAKLDDYSAAGKLNSVIAGPKARAVGQPQTLRLAGRAFIVSEFELSEPPLLKHAKIFTTLCEGQLVSFTFVSNAAGQVRAMEQTLNTLEFSGH